MDKLMKNIIYLFLLTLIVRSQPISENLAFRKVMENLKGSIPESYNLAVNSNHELIGNIIKQKTKKKRTNLINQVLDLALLSQGMLKGEDLTSFINRSVNLIK